MKLVSCIFSRFSLTTTTTYHDNMPIDFYYNPVSAPCRTVLLAAKTIGVELNLISINPHERDQVPPEFIKLNPQHTIPTINDNGFALWESRAIITYLQNKYGRKDSLYPKDPKKRAVVDHRLFFDMDLDGRLHQVFTRSSLAGAPVDPEKVELANKSIEYLDAFLDKTEYVAGDNLTLADLALVVQISTIEVAKYDLSPYKNIKRWHAKIKTTVPGYKELVEDNLVLFQELLKTLSGSQ